MKKLKYYVQIIEDLGRRGESKWGIVFGNPNPDKNHYFSCENQERAEELRDKINLYFKEVEINYYKSLLKDNQIKIWKKN